MFRRLISFFITFALIVSMVTVPSLAIGPQDAFIASAILSFVSSAGIHLFRDGLETSGAEDSLVDDMQTLWSDFISGFDGTVPSWEAVVGGDSITVSSGKFIYDYSIALTLQDFTNWLSSRYNFKPFLSYDLITTSDYYFGYPGKNVKAVPVDYSKTVEYRRNGTEIAYSDPHVIATSGQTSYFTGLDFDPGELSDKFYLACAIPTNSDQIWLFVYIPDGIRSSTSKHFLSLYGVEEPYYINTRNLSFTSNGPKWAAVTPFSSSTVFTFPVSDYNDLISEIDPPFPPSSGVSTLVADVGSSVSDLTYDLIKPVIDSTTGDVISPGQSLAIDVGLDADAAADDLVDRVVGGYVGGERAIGGFEAVATPVPMEGTQELYPQPAIDDVEGLGLPALGQALTNVFPFCLPFDVVAMVKSLNAEALPPRFKVDLVTDSMRSRLKMSTTTDTSFTIDLSDPKFDVIHKLIYWGTTLTFCISLALATKRLSWSSGG